MMSPLRAKPANYGTDPPYFDEKIIKYTKSKPMLIWSENPRHASQFYMPRTMLLENCDSSSLKILHSIINK